MVAVKSVGRTALTVDKETAQLEAKAYELQQRTALAAEAKQVLDSWVRYEGQVRQRQQRELAETIIGKIQKELENPKVLQQILQQSVSDVERKLVGSLCAASLTCIRHYGIQAPVTESSLDFITMYRLQDHSALCH